MSHRHHRSTLRHLSVFGALAMLAAGCAGSSDDTSDPPSSSDSSDLNTDPAAADEPEAQPEESDAVETPSFSIDCKTSKAKGYYKGKPMNLTVVHVDGKPVEEHTADAYYVMASAAERAGVHLRVVSGFRTMQEQQYLYNCYIHKNCNGGALAAKPGTSNHQSGHAVDLNTSAPHVYAWLHAHAKTYGFERTVPLEQWHWEWHGKETKPGRCVKKVNRAETSDVSAAADDDASEADDGTTGDTP